MINNLRVLKKELKSFAKRVKNFKYTESALITFLLTGLIELTGVSFNLFSAENEIQAQTKAINTSITSIKSDFRFARHENNKLLKKTNLELVKLMEQGDHVVKSPWSSWQYGINGFYNSWQGSYKGRGDKTADYKYERDKTMSKTKYEAYPHTLYGNTTELGMRQEPNATIPVSASLTPLIPRVKQANISMAVDISELPSFNPRTVTPPTAPTISPVGTINAPSFTLMSRSLANGGEKYYDNRNLNVWGGGVIEGGVILENGNFVVSRIENTLNGQGDADGFGNYKYSYKNYIAKNAFNADVSGMKSDNSSIILYKGNTSPSLDRLTSDRTWKKRSGFIRLVSDNAEIQGGALVNKATFLYTREPNLAGPFINELVHMDMHGGKNIGAQLTDSGFTSGAEYDAFTDLKDIAKNTSNSTKSQTFINSGKIVIEGEKASFVNAYDHVRDNKATDPIVSSIVNTSGGDVTIHPYIDNNGNKYNTKSAVFIVSAEVAGKGNPQIIYNAGNVSLYNNESAVYFINPNGDVRWNHAKQNRTESNWMNDDASAADITNGFASRSGSDILDNDDDDQREITIVNRANGTNKAVKTYGDGDVGIYLKTSKYISTANLDFKTQSTGGDWAPLVIYGDNNIGLYAPKDETSQLTIKPSGTVIGNFAVNIGDASGNYNNYKSYTASNLANLGTPSDEYTTAGKTGQSVTLNDGVIDKSYGIFSSISVDFERDTTKAHSVDPNGKGIENGHEINLFTNVKESIGVLTGDDANIKLGKGKIELKGGSDNTGIIVGGTDTTVSGAKSTDGKVTGDVVKITGDSRNDRGNRAIFAGNSANNEVTVNAVVSTDATNSITLVADKGAKITVNDSVTGTTPTIISAPMKAGVQIAGSEFHHDFSRVNSDLTSKDNVGAAYASGGGIININRTSSTKPTSGANISIKGGTDQQSKKKVGFGLFADGSNSKINAQNNWIKVTNGATNVASLSNAEIDLKGATVEYKGEGYALYTNTTSKNSGAINMSDAKLVLDGKAVGYVYYQDKPNMITVNPNTSIDILDDDVIVADLRKTSGQVTVNVENKATPDRLRDQLIGGVGSVGSTNGKTRYKYAVVDNAQINIKSAVDKADNSGTDTDSEVFAKRFLYQNSKIDVTTAGSVKAELDDTQMKAIDVNLKTPVGLAVTASAQTKDNDTTGISNSGTVSADRTVGSDRGGIGLYVDYGYINNNTAGTVNVEKGTVNNPNDKAIGIFGTNSTKIVNDGKVNAGGKKSIGILGLSYRIDSKTELAIDPKTETYYANVIANSGHPFGVVDVENGATGKITMDNDGAVGMFVKNNSTDKDSSGNYVVTNASDIKTKNETRGVNKGEITINGNDSSVGMGANNGIITNASSGKINVNGTKSAGMYGTNDSDLINNGEINVAATSAGNESIGMYIDDQVSTIANTGKINVGKSSYGIYGKDVNMTAGEINVADDGVGVYSTGPSVNLSGGKIDVANNNSVGVYIADDSKNPQATTVTSSVDMKVGDTDSFGYLITASKAKTDLTINPTANSIHVGEKSVYVYSGAPQSLGGKIINKSDIVMDKNNGYGIYSSQDAQNYGSIDLRAGIGNIGIYSTQGNSKNFGVIAVGPSNVTSKQYGIGMATGYYNETTKVSTNEGTIENYGTINVSDDNSVGMYAVGSGSKAINKGTINLSGNNTTGMYIDRYATGENYGTIQTTPTTNGTGIKGVVVANGGVIKNYGTINIVGSKNIGVYAFRGDVTDSSYVPYEAHGTGNVSTRPYLEGTATDQKVTGKAIVKVPPASLPSPVSISIDGVDVAPVKVDTNIASPEAPEVLITDLSGVTKLNLETEKMDHNHTHSNGEISTIGMYVDTSGINYTNPIQGLNNLSGLTDVDLIMGTEVTKYLNAKAIQIGDNILKPYNDALASVVSTGVTLNVNSASLTWIAQPVESGNIAAPIKTVYMVKIPYTDFASKNDVDTEHFLDGLEQRYGVEDIHSREKQIFNKLNDLGKGEPHIFAQAVNEMKGYEYSNTQQRINATGNALDKEFKYLWKDWRNPSKQNNKIKVFGMKDEYKTNTAGVIDYDSNAWGVAYVHEDEKVQIGKSSGWYIGAVTNRFKFKDLGKSREDQTMIKLGIFKTMSPRKDYNGALQWTIAGDIFGGINNMHRKYWVVDDTFEAKSTYNSYGAALKNELGYDIRMSERTHLRPYGALKMEYGRFNEIKENSGQMRLEVKGNDYFSVKPEAGLEFKYIQPLAVRTQLSVGLTAAYENEIGKLNKLNQARVRYTTADWYNLRNEKENRRENGKFDLNIGVDNTRFGMTVNAGYDTRGNNVRGGIGFRAIY
ncbi:autotransporter beta-domain protein [Leptotrichia wadei]|uniref:Autotransporter beta-domain protein n=2 Tax=Leptotrichia wadei TaxID=157687 RepID=A0A510K5L1_9FUSO|nr:autotransporter-associated N-terminal domain-containing protein [Leptotrichia wadei]BBM46932.1 autotransporter beta-domain protein [Leptotrichia wadei]